MLQRNRVVDTDWGSGSDYTFQHLLDITNVTATIQNTMNNLAVQGGRDYPEAQLEVSHRCGYAGLATDPIRVCFAMVVRTSQGLLRATSCESTIGWRENARRLILVSTDAWFHMRGEGPANYLYTDTDLATPLHSRYLLQNNGDCTEDVYEDYPSVWYEETRNCCECAPLNVLLCSRQLKAALEKYNIVPIFALADDGTNIQVRFAAPCHAGLFALVSTLHALRLSTTISSRSSALAPACSSTRTAPTSCRPSGKATRVRDHVCCSA